MEKAQAINHASVSFWFPELCSGSYHRQNWSFNQKIEGFADNSSVEVYLLIKNLALDIISEAAFGYDLKVQENPDGKLVKVCLFNYVYVAQKDILLVFISPIKRLLNI